MRIVIGAPGNGTVLKDALKEFLRADPRATQVIDLSEEGITYPDLSFQAAELILEGKADRGLLTCGTGIGTAIAASKVPGIRAGTAHDLVTVRGLVENYDAQIFCMGQNVIAAPAAAALLDEWLGLVHDPTSDYGALLEEISDYEGDSTRP